MTSVRLTTGQAIVRYMARQHVERDGHQQCFIAGVWGIFGHGNVAGLGQALEELGDAERMPYYRPQNDRGQVHDRVTMIVVPTAPETRTPGFAGWWEVPAAEVSGQVGVQKARLTYEKARAQQRLG